jgi:hypothetical protein
LGQDRRIGWIDLVRGRLLHREEREVDEEWEQNAEARRTRRREERGGAKNAEEHRGNVVGEE